MTTPLLDIRIYSSSVLTTVEKPCVSFRTKFSVALDNIIINPHRTRHPDWATFEFRYPVFLMEIPAISMLRSFQILSIGPGILGASSMIRRP